MQCARCHKSVPDGAPIWRVSVGYGGMYYPPAVQSWCAVCSATLAHRLPDFAENWSEGERQRLLASYPPQWHPERSCDQCGRPVFFDVSRRIPLHAVCGDICRSAVKLAQARARRARRFRPQATCSICGKLFRPIRTDARFCSGTCRQRAYRQRQHAEAA
jgi:hypothetical protein